MNLIEARKLGHKGWVRSPTRTINDWVNCNSWHGEDLDAEDWEPKPEPEPEARNLYEFEIWFNVRTGLLREYFHFLKTEGLQEDGWRKIHVREVT